MVATAQNLSLFTELVGAEHVREATASDAIGGVLPGIVVSPGDESEVSSVLSAATARGLSVIARAGGTKIDWGSAPRGCDVVLSTSRIAGIIDHEPADLVCVVKAGTTLARLQAALGTVPGFRQRLMLDPPQGDNATVGGIVATAASGPLRTRFGTARDLVIGASFVLADGTIGRSGGKVVKNVAGFDVAKLLVGSLGTLAVITEVAFRLHPVPASSRTVVYESRSTRDLCAFAARLDALQVTPSIVDLHWPEGLVLVRFESSERGAAVQAERVTQALGGRILEDAEEAALTSALSGSPWSGAGSVGGLSVLPARVADLLSSLSATCAAVVLRPLLGSGEMRCAPDALDMVRTAVRAIGGRIVIKRGEATATGEVEDEAALELMRSVKRQLDPSGTLSPGRQPGGV